MQNYNTVNNNSEALTEISFVVTRAREEFTKKEGTSCRLETVLLAALFVSMKCLGYVNHL